MLGVFYKDLPLPVNGEAAFSSSTLLKDTLDKNSPSQPTCPDAMAAPALSYDPPITFSTVIEDDHNTINKYAGRLLRAKTPQDRARLLHEVTWRLVRHDVSEDLVMRPAFVEQLGEEGQQMAEHDRGDHERAKQELLALFTDVALESPAFPTAVRKLFAELLEHMKVESGEQIPALERSLGALESQRLGREYIKTQALTPDLEMVDKRDGVRRRVWRDVEDYARTDLARFRQIWEDLTEEHLKLELAGYYRTYSKGKL